MDLSKTRESVSRTLEDVDVQIDKTTKKHPKLSTVSFSLSEEQKEQVKKKYTENMRLNIKSWADTEVKTLRKKIETRVSKGQRYEGMIESLKKEFGGSVAHAKFVARQETHLLLAEVREQKYRKAGVMRYKWRTLNFATGKEKGNVRPDHAHLNNKVFDWDHPPVVDARTGRRGHPGQDYGCRCTALPVID